jgi:hypothetical protein
MVEVLKSARVTSGDHRKVMDGSGSQGQVKVAVITNQTLKPVKDLPLLLA